MDEQFFEGAETEPSGEQAGLKPEREPSSAGTATDQTKFKLPENQGAKESLPSLELFDPNAAGGIGGGAEGRSAGQTGRMTTEVVGTKAPTSALRGELDTHPLAATMGEAVRLLTSSDQGGSLRERLRQVAALTQSATDANGADLDLVTSRNTDAAHQIVPIDRKNDRAAFIGRVGENFIAIDDGKGLTLVALEGDKVAGTITFDKAGKPVFAGLKPDDTLPFRSSEEHRHLATELMHLSQRYGPGGMNDAHSLRQQNEKEQKALDPISGRLKNAADELADVANLMRGETPVHNRDTLEVRLRDFVGVDADAFTAKTAEKLLTTKAENSSDEYTDKVLRQALADHYLTTGQYNKAAPHFKQILAAAASSTKESADSEQARAETTANQKKLALSERSVEGERLSLQVLKELVKPARSYFSSTRALESQE